MTTSDDESPNSKVARVIREYDLDGWGGKLEAKWTGTEGERTSLRELADVFNREVLRSALNGAGVAMSDHDVRTTYQILTEDDVARADLLRKERELERDGVDVEGLRGDFVTHQAIHTYLTKYREAELTEIGVDRDRKAEMLKRLEGRTAAVSESTLNGLVRAEEVTDREYELFVETRVVCEECGSGYTLVELISEGGCHCDIETTQ